MLRTMMIMIIMLDSDDDDEDDDDDDVCEECKRIEDDGIDDKLSLFDLWLIIAHRRFFVSLRWFCDRRSC